MPHTMTQTNIFERPKKTQRRVVVTGIGALTPLGLNVESSWDNMIQGRSGVGRVTAFDASEIDAQIAAEVKGFEPDTYLEKKEQKKMDRFIHFAIAAAQMAHD